MICMSERSNVSIAEILGENYKITNIECSDYNPSIDGNITVTITVTDVFGDAISNESVTVTASEGTFTQLNGSSITAAATVTATTNISGQFTLTYNCTEWGLITFNANNTNNQINVVGWKQVYSNSGLLIYKNQDDITKLIITVNMNYNSASWAIIRSFPSEYLPQKTLFSDSNQGNVRFRVPDYTINGLGAVQYISTSSYNGSLGTMFLY